MLIVVIVVGLLYALPNLYGEDPAVQITGVRGAAASEQTLIQSRKRYKKIKSHLSLWLWKRVLFSRASTPLIPNCAHVKY